MDVFEDLCNSQAKPGRSVIKTVDMHTSGEPTRIIIDGYPELQGATLLEKRAYALVHHDEIRKQLMREPRGHADMYGAILVKETELTMRGEADIGVLFCHNDGYSTMCGHATIALGRFLVDTHDIEVFPRRGQLRYDEETRLTEIRLHAPCGVVQVKVPTVLDRSDETRAVSFLGVPSFVTARNYSVSIPEEKRWRRLAEAGRNDVRVDVAYGGAFYAIVSAEELGFAKGLKGGYELGEYHEATAALKGILKERKELFRHPSEQDLEYLYGVMVVDKSVPGEGGESGLCYFADQQVDRSPTGSCVCARVALGIEEGRLEVGEGWRYESIVSLQHKRSSFVGTAVERGKEGVVVKVEGSGFYIGASCFVAEEEDGMPHGFVFGMGMT